jgi:hypothetical protein
LSIDTPANPKRREPDAGARESRLRRFQPYAGLGLAVGVTIAWVAVLLVLVWRVAGLALDVVA